jgi:hypothetical protein
LRASGGELIMSVVDQCRREAEICRHRAEQASLNSTRALLLSVARTWLTLAERMEVAFAKEDAASRS